MARHRAHSLSSSIAQPGRTQGAPLPTQKLVSAISTGKHNPFQHATLQVLYNTTIRLEQLEATACMYKSSISIGTTQRHEIPIIEAARHTGEAKCRNMCHAKAFLGFLGFLSFPGTWRSSPMTLKVPGHVQGLRLSTAAGIQWHGHGTQ